MKEHVVIFTTFDEDQKQKLRAVSDRLVLHFDTEEDVIPYLNEAVAIIGIVPEPYRKQLRTFSKLRLLQLPSAGYEEWEKRVDIPLCNSSGVFGSTIAEYVIGNILLLYRHSFSYRAFQTCKDWHPSRLPIETLRHKNALILGVGDVGSNIASRLKEFGAKTIGLRKKQQGKVGFDRIDSLQNIHNYLPSADLVINCLPSNEDTNGFFKEEMMRTMPKNALFINVGRGKFVKTALLERAMKEKWIAGMILDVFEEEPLPESSSLWEEKNVIITPHISGGYAMRSTKELFSDLVAINLKNLVLDQPFKNQVNRVGAPVWEFDH